MPTQTALPRGRVLSPIFPAHFVSIACSFPRINLLQRLRIAAWVYSALLHKACDNFIVQRAGTLEYCKMDKPSNQNGVTQTDF